MARRRSSAAETPTAPLATALLAAGVVGGYALELAGDGMALCTAHGFIPARPGLETALSSLFLHDPGTWAHVGGNLVFLLVFGVLVERAIGRLGLLALYAAAGLGGAWTHALVDPGSTTPLVGASGALFGLLALVAVLRPRLLVFAVAYVGVNVWGALSGGAGDVSFGCHLGGFFVGFVAVALMRLAGSEALEPA